MKNFKYFSGHVEQKLQALDVTAAAEQVAPKLARQLSPTFREWAIEAVEETCRYVDFQLTITTPKGRIRETMFRICFG